MDIEESKKLQPGMRVRITSTPHGWWFDAGDMATLVRLDTSDDDGDWIAEFDDGYKRYIEPSLGVDFEVVEE